MEAPHHFLAIDLGAESGRAVLGDLAGGRLAMREVHRFENGPVEIDGHLHWDLDRIHGEVLAGIAAAARAADGPLASLAVDTFGVDFALLGADGALLGPPYAYRDRRTAGAMEQFFARVPRERVYLRTGIQMMPINTLFQLFVMARDGAPELAAARRLLFIPDALGFLLTGAARSEFTIATTSQLFDPRAGEWAADLLAAVGVPASLLPEVAPPGTALGAHGGVPVVSTASHDTAAAVAAVPMEGPGAAYVSSGTWSLVGVETDAPVITPATLALNFTNEGGVGGKTRLLKNVMGLWLFQQCRRSLAAERPLTFTELTRLAAEAPPSQAVLDPDWPGFLNPPDMPEAIGRYLDLTGQPRPAGPGALARLVLTGLALKTRLVIEELEEVSRAPIDRIHVVGGGSKNELLCRLTADATHRPVLAGPAEATAAGNILVQALAAGEVSGLPGIRKVSRRSFPVRRHEPRGDAALDAAAIRLRDLVRAFH